MNSGLMLHVSVIKRKSMMMMPPWRQPRGKQVVSSVNSHTNAARIDWQLWDIVLRFAPGLPLGWVIKRKLMMNSDDRTSVSWNGVKGGNACLFIRKYDHFTPTRETKH